ncbi:MAG: MFS transporter [archaeon]
MKRTVRTANFILVMCWFAWIVNYLNRMILPPLLPLIIPEMHLSLTEAGLLMSGFMFGYAVMPLPSGMLADRYGRKIVLVFGMLGYSAFTFLSAFTTTFAQLFLCRVLTGLSQGTHLSVANSLLSDFFPSSRRGRAIGIHESGPNVGSTIAMPFAAVIGAFSGWRPVFALAALFGLVMAVLFYSLVPETTRESKPVVRKERKLTNLAGWWGPLLPFILAFSGYTFSNWALYTFTPIYLSSKGLELVTVGLVFAILPFVGIFSKILGGTISDLVDRRKVIVGALALLGSLMYLLTLMSGTVEIAVLLGFLGFVLFSFSPVVYARVSELYDASERSSAIGAVSTIGNLVGAISPALVGFVADQAGFQVSFYLIAAVVLACALSSAFVMRRHT